MEEFVKKKTKHKIGTIVKLLDKENYGKLGVITNLTTWDIMGLSVDAYDIIGYKSGTVSYDLVYDDKLEASIVYLDGLFEKY